MNPGESLNQDDYPSAEAYWEAQEEANDRYKAAVEAYLDEIGYGQADAPPSGEVMYMTLLKEYYPESVAENLIYGLKSVVEIFSLRDYREPIIGGFIHPDFSPEMRRKYIFYVLLTSEFFESTEEERDYWNANAGDVEYSFRSTGPNMDSDFWDMYEKGYAPTKVTIAEAAEVYRIIRATYPELPDEVVTTLSEARALFDKFGYGYADNYDEEGYYDGYIYWMGDYEKVEEGENMIRYESYNQEKIIIK